MSSPHIVALPSLLFCKHVRREPQAYTYTHSLKNDLFFLTKCSLAAFIAIRGIKGYRMSNQKIKRRDGVGVQVIDQLLHPQSGSQGHDPTPSSINPCLCFLFQVEHNLVGRGSLLYGRSAPSRAPTKSKQLPNPHARWEIRLGDGKRSSRQRHCDSTDGETGERIGSTKLTQSLTRAAQ